MKTANDLADIELSTSDGGSMKIGELWSTTPVVLVFVRHFG
jgi:hypothetical protein